MKTRFTKIASLLLAVLLLVAMVPVQAVALEKEETGGDTKELDWVCLAGIHQFDAGEVTKPATCTQPGETTKTCALCGAEEINKSLPAALGHDFTAEVADPQYLKTAATCQAYAVYYKSCARTGCTVSSQGTAYEDTFEYTDGGYNASNHSYTEDVVDAQYLKTAATCQAYAVYYKSCACGASAQGVTDQTFDYTDGGYDATNHVADTSAWEKDETGHWRACTNKEHTDAKLAFATHEYVEGFCSVCGFEQPAPAGVRGDFNGDEGVTVADVLYLLDYTFDPSINLNDQSGDVNNDGSVTVADVLYLLDYTFDNTIVLYN